jgi:DHA1 family tetracycline resistance protein-like MFS transporter
MATCADGAAGPPNRATAIHVCLVAVTADYCGVGMMRTLLPFYAKRMAPGSGATLLGALETAYGVGQIIGATVLGRLSDTRGRKVVLLLSFVGSAIGYGFTAVATTPAMLVFSRLPVGLAKQTVATARAILADCVPRHELSGMMARLIKMACAGAVSQTSVP